MVSKKQSGKLPSDWTEHLSVKNGKTTKYYTNAATGQKFCSRQSLDRYLNARGVFCEAKITSAVSTGSVRSDNPTSTLAVVKKDKPREWLPQGWIMESRKRGFSKHGSVYRVYIEKSTGCKFYSKGKVLQYLEKVHGDSNIGKEFNEANEMSEHKESVEDKRHISGDKDEPKVTMSEHSESVEDKCHKSGKKNAPKLTMSEHGESMEDKCHKSGKKNAPKLTMSEHGESMVDKCPKSGKKNAPKLTMSEHGESMVDKCPKSGKKNAPKLTMSEHSESAEDKCHKSGKKNAPKLTMSEHSESVEDECHKSGKKNAPSDPALEDKGNKKEVADDELPQGWIKELRTRSFKGKTKQDPYYKDPATGYIFRSKKDVWRFLKTGDIKKCASKVQKGNTPQSSLSVNAKKMKPSASTSQLSDVAGKDVDEKPGYVEAVECHKSEENSVTKNEGFKQESNLVDDNEVSSLARITPWRKSKRKPLSVPQRSSKRLAGINRDVNESTLTDAVKEETGRSLSLSSKVTVNGVNTSLGCGVAKDTKALFNDEAVNEVPPQQLDTNIYTESSNPAVNEVSPQKTDTNIYTESSNATVSEVPPQQLDTNIYTESNNPAVNEMPPQQIDANLYTESSNSTVSEVPPQQLDTNIYTESSNPAVNEVSPQKTDTNLFIESSNATVSEVPPQQLDTNIYTESNNPAVNEIPPQQIDANLYTESSNATVSEVPPQQLVTDIYTESNNPAGIEMPHQQIDANLYTKSSNAAVNEVTTQQLDTNLCNESINAPVNEPVHDTTEPGVKRSVEIDAAVDELPQEFVTNFDAIGPSAAASQSRVEMDLNSTLELLFEDMDVQQQQTSAGQENEARKEVDLKFQGDYWTDPCFDFAFKTIAGGEPFGDTIELDSCFQQHVESSSYTQGEEGEEGGSAVPDMNAPPSLVKNKETMNSESSVPEGISVDELPENGPNLSVCKS